MPEMSASQAVAWLSSRLPDDRRYLAAMGATAVAASVGALSYLLSSPRPPAIDELIPLNNQSVELEPGLRASHLVGSGSPRTYMYEDAKTSYEGFKRGIRVSDDGPCLGVRSGPGGAYQWQTYQQVYERSHQLGSGMVHLGAVPSNDTIIGIYSANRPEWVYADQACAMFSMVSVPLYDTLGAEACSYIINKTNMSVVICDTAAKAQQLLSSAAEMPSLKTIIMFDETSNNNEQLAQKNNIKIVSVKQVMELGKANPRDPVPPKPDDLFTICFTSGTTGDPKGVMLTHKNCISDMAAVIVFLQLDLTKEDVHISYLPLAHMFERCIHIIMFMHGCQIGFFSGDVRKLLEDIGVLRPTLFLTVPRLLNRIYDKVLQGVAQSRLKQALFNLAFNRKKALLSRGITTQTSLWDKLVFGRIQNMLGGRVRVVLTGSAPLSPSVLDFIRCAFGCLVIEGYGQTECTAGATMTPINETNSGTVGPPLPCNQVKLVDVPEMDYYVKDNKGEVCMRGPNVMVGYYKDEERTREAFDEDGWLHSGDVGMWMPNGSLKIIDRRKHIFKLAQGEYIAPEKIEGVYMKSMYVAQAFVDGNSLEICTVGILVPDPEVIPGWAKKHGIEGTMEQLCQNETLKAEILKDIINLGKESGLKGFEQVKAIHLHSEAFSLQNGLLTPTFKSKRPALRKVFANKIQQLYQETKATKK